MVKPTDDTARLGVGGNSRVALVSAEALAREYAPLVENVEELIAEATKADAEITDDAGDADVTELGRALAKRVRENEDVRKSAKQPYLDAGRVVDGYFNNLNASIEAAMEKLRARLTVWKRKKAAEEAAKRAEQERAAREAAAAAEREAARLREAAEHERREAEAAVAFDVAPVATPAVQMGEVKAAEDAAAVAALQARSAQQQAAAPLTDLTRTRSASGVGGSTLDVEWKFAIENVDEVPLDQLRPFLSAAEIEKAVARYVKLHKGSKPLAGVRIYPEEKARLYG